MVLAALKMSENFSFSDDSSQTSEEPSEHSAKTKYPKPKRPKSLSNSQYCCINISGASSTVSYSTNQRFALLFTI